MRAPLVRISLALSLVTAPIAAQTVNPYCQDPQYVGVGQEGGIACQLALDTYAYGSQQYATLMAAGNMEIGSADALGSFPRFRVALHVTGMNVVAPAYHSTEIVQGPVTTPENVATQSTDFATVSADGALGLFGGFNLGIAKFGALDAFLSLNLVPGATAAGYSVTPNNKFYFGYGGRVGIMQETKVLPGVGVSYFVRNLPMSYLVASDVFQNTIYLSQLKVDTHAWSATVGKHFKAVSLVLGAGQTSFTSSAVLSWVVNGINGTIPAISASSTQTQYFGDFGVQLGGSVGIAVELGEVTGSQLMTFNTFDPASTATRSYLSFAITFGK